MDMQKKSPSARSVIGFVSRHNPMTDRKAWSGTFYKIREAIQDAGVEVKWVRVQPDKLLSFLIKGWFKLTGRVKYWELSKYYGWLCARSVRLDDVRACDRLLFPWGAQMIDFLHKRLSGSCPPIIYYTDATFRLMADYYWFDIPAMIYRQADEVEKSANDCSALVIKSSDWAVRSAIRDYDCPPEKTAVLEFGANIDEKDIVICRPYTGGEFRVLFSGVDWVRKGADIAVDTVRKLNEDGIEARLYLAGINPDRIPSGYQNLPFVEYVGFLDKNDSKQYQQYMEMVGKCHCLLLPTHAECSATVFNEASAFGLPSFTYDTGGLGNYVIDGENGFRLDIHSSAEDFARIIERIIKNDGFEKLHEGALRLYKEKNSWKAWSRRFATLMVNRF